MRKKKLNISNNATAATESSKGKEFDQNSSDGENNLKSFKSLSICNSNDQCNGAQIFSQLLPTLAANIGSFSSGLALGFPAVLFPQLSQEDNDDQLQFLHDNLTLDQMSAASVDDTTFLLSNANTNIIVQMYGVGAVLGILLATILGQLYGRRACLMFLAVPDMIGWVITAIATNTVLLQSARFISGVAGGGYILCVQVFVGEICSCHHRGWLLSLATPITALGVLTMYVTSGLLPWHCTAAACCPVPALLVVTIMFYWDSPYWYIHNNNQQCARQALTQFRGTGSDLDLEMDEINQQLGGRLSITECLAFIFSSKHNFKPFLILNSLYLLVLLCGKFAIDYYAVEVFIRFGSNLTEYLAGMVAAILSMLGSLFLILLVKYLSRKTLMVVSTMLMLVSLVMLGVCSYSHSHNITLLQDCNWLPITCVVSYIMATNMGLSSLPNIFISEFYSPQTRCVWGGLTLAMSQFELILATYIMPRMEEVVAKYTLFWFFAIMCVCVIIFTCNYIPETKNRDVSMIEHKFLKLGKVIRASPWSTPCPSPSATSVRKLHFKSHLFTQ